MNLDSLLAIYRSTRVPTGVDKALLSEKRAMRVLYLGLAALVTPAHALGKPDITFILGAPHLPCLSLSSAPCSAAEGSGRSWLTDRAPS